MERYQQISWSWIKGKLDALPCQISIFECLRRTNVDIRTREKNAGLPDEMLSKVTEQFVQLPFH